MLRIFHLISAIAWGFALAAGLIVFFITWMMFQSGGAAQQTAALTWGCFHGIAIYVTAKAISAIALNISSYMAENKQ